MSPATRTNGKPRTNRETVHLVGMSPFKDFNFERVSDTTVRINEWPIRRCCVASLFNPNAFLNHPAALKSLVKDWYLRSRRCYEALDPIAESLFAADDTSDTQLAQLTIEVADPSKDAPDLPSGFPSSVQGVRRRLDELPSARFLRPAPETMKERTAHVFGPPLFAIAALAQDVLDAGPSSILIGGSAQHYTIDGGRWLQLFNRFLPGPARTFTLCCKSKPMRTAIAEILFHPAPRIVQKPWLDHLESLKSPPDILLVVSEEDFDRVHDAVEVLQKLPTTTAVLWSSSCLPLAEIEAAFFRAYGFDVGPITWLDQSFAPCNAYTIGAVSMRITPPGETTTHISRDRLDALRTTYNALSDILTRELTYSQDRRHLAAQYGTPTRIHLPDAAARTTLSIGAGRDVDVSTGDVLAYTAESTYRIIPNAVPSELMRLCPVSEGIEANRLETMQWIAKARLAIDPQLLLPDREAQPVAAGEGTPPATTSEVPPAADCPESAIPPTAPATDASADIEVAAPGSETPPGAQGPALFRLRPRLSTAAGNTPVMAVSASIGAPPASPQDAFRGARDAMRAWLEGKGFPVPTEATSLTLEQPGGEVTIEADGEDIWALRYDDRNLMEKGAFWRVEATLIGRDTPAFGLRVSQIRRRESAPPPQPGAPRVVRDIADHVGLFDCGQPLRSRPWTPAGASEAERLLALIENPRRLQPVVVVATRSVGELVQASDHLASRLTGTAHVVRIEADIAEVMDRRLGRSRGVHDRMIRLYPPQFSLDDDPFGIPLWTLPTAHAGTAVLDLVVGEACAQGLAAVSLDERVPSFQQVRQVIVDGRLANAQRLTQQAHASADEERDRARQVITEMTAALATYRTEAQESREAVIQLQEECERLRRERDVADDENRRLRFRIQATRRETAAEPFEQVAGEDPEPAYPADWESMDDWVKTHCEGRVVVLPQAIKAAKASSYPDIAFTYQVIELLARHYVPMRQREADDESLVEAFEAARAELGVDISRVGNAVRDRRYRHEYKRTYAGRSITLDLHVKRGVGFDPTAIFRLYFAYLEKEGQVCIGHFPEHLTNSVTH